MTKTIKICDKCGKEVDWLFEIYLMKFKRRRVDYEENDKYDLCTECTKELVEKYNNFANSQKEVSF